MQTLNTTKTKRLDWLDVLKCLAMFAVICGHAATVDTQGSLKFYIYAFHMPLFFIISGMTLYLQLSRHEYTFKNILLNKCRTLLWPYLIFNLLLIPLWFCYFKLFDPSAGSVPGLLVAIVYSNPTWSSLPISASWFLTTLFLSSLLLFAALKLCKGRSLSLFITCMIIGIIGYIISCFDSINLLYPWHISTVPIATMLLMFGFLFMKHLPQLNEKVFKFKNRTTGYYVHALLWIVVTFFAGIITAKNNARITMGLNHYGNFLLFIAAVIAFSLMFYVLSLIIPPLPVFKLIGRNTIVYLCLHELCIIAMNTLSGTTKAFVTQMPVLASLIIFAVLIPIAYFIEKKLPWLIGRKKK